MTADLALWLIGAVLTIMVPMGGWLYRRLDDGLANLRSHFDDELTKIDARQDERIGRLHDRLDQFQHENAREHQGLGERMATLEERTRPG